MRCKRVDSGKSQALGMCEGSEDYRTVDEEQSIRGSTISANGVENNEQRGEILMRQVINIRCVPIIKALNDLV